MVALRNFREGERPEKGAHGFSGAGACVHMGGEAGRLETEMHSLMKQERSMLSLLKAPCILPQGCMYFPGSVTVLTDLFSGLTYPLWSQPITHNYISIGSNQLSCTEVLVQVRHSVVAAQYSAPTPKSPAAVQYRAHWMPPLQLSLLPALVRIHSKSKYKHVLRPGISRRLTLTLASLSPSAALLPPRFIHTWHSRPKGPVR